MSVDLDVTQQAGIEPVEAPFWAPPEAPLDMPLQVLEVARARRGSGGLWRWLPRARA